MALITTTPLPPHNNARLLTGSNQATSPGTRLDALAADIFLKVLENDYLTIRDVKALGMVCQRFRDLVGQAPLRQTILSAIRLPFYRWPLSKEDCIGYVTSRGLCTPLEHEALTAVSRFVKRNAATVNPSVHECLSIALGSSDPELRQCLLEQYAQLKQHLGNPISCRDLLMLEHITKHVGAAVAQYCQFVSAAHRKAGTTDRDSEEKLGLLRSVLTNERLCEACLRPLVEWVLADPVSSAALTHDDLTLVMIVALYPSQLDVMRLILANPAHSAMLGGWNPTYVMLKAIEDSQLDTIPRVLADPVSAAMLTGGQLSCVMLYAIHTSQLDVIDTLLADPARSAARTSQELIMLMFEAMRTSQLGVIDILLADPARSALLTGRDLKEIMFEAMRTSQLGVIDTLLCDPARSALLTRDDLREIMYEAVRTSQLGVVDTLHANPICSTTLGSEEESLAEYD